MRERVTEDEFKIARNEFWGICCESGKKYFQVVSQRFLVTMAALEPLPETEELRQNPYVSLLLEHDGSEYLLCTLKHNAILQVNLNLHFAKGEDVTFYLRGKGRVHLSGYHIFGDGDVIQKREANEVNHSENVENDVEVSKAKKKKKRKVKREEVKVPEEEILCNDEKEEVEEFDDDEDDDDDDDDDDDEEEEDEEEEEWVEEIDGRSIIEFKERSAMKVAKELCAKQLLNKDEEEDEEDVDFAIGMKLPDEYDDEEEEEGGEDEVDEEEEEDELEDDDERNEEEVEEKSSSNDDDEEEEEVPAKQVQFVTPGPSKRKTLSPNLQAKKKKRLSEQRQTAKIVKVDDDDVKLEELSDSGEMNSSIGHTPMPKKKFKSCLKSDSSSALLKKGKVMDEGLTKGKEQASSDTSFSKILPSGVEFEDVKIGSGPMARRGKYVHVNFVGKLGNGMVFEDRSGGKPFSFKMGENHVIKGLDRGIEGMKVGGKRRLKIPPKLGYGKAGSDKIPPDSFLYFNVDLKAVS